MTLTIAILLSLALVGFIAAAMVIIRLLDRHEALEKRHKALLDAARGAARQPTTDTISKLREAILRLSVVLFIFGVWRIDAGTVAPLVATRPVKSLHHRPFLETLAMVESSGNPRAIGDGGRALGLYQMHAAAWADVSVARAKRGLQVYPHAAAHDPDISREYAAEYLQILSRNFSAATGREPTSIELYACWNLGLSKFRRCGFSLTNAPKITRRAAARFQNVAPLAPFVVRLAGHHRGLDREHIRSRAGRE